MQVRVMAPRHSLQFQPVLKRIPNLLAQLMVGVVGGVKGDGGQQGQKTW